MDFIRQLPNEAGGDGMMSMCLRYVWRPIFGVTALGSERVLLGFLETATPGISRNIQMKIPGPRERISEMNRPSREANAALLG